MWYGPRGAVGAYTARDDTHKYNTRGARAAQSNMAPAAANRFISATGARVCVMTSTTRGAAAARARSRFEYDAVRARFIIIFLQGGESVSPGAGRDYWPRINLPTSNEQQLRSVVRRGLLKII